MYGTVLIHPKPKKSEGIFLDSRHAADARLSLQTCLLECPVYIESQYRDRSTGHVLRLHVLCKSCRCLN